MSSVKEFVARFPYAAPYSWVLKHLEESVAVEHATDADVYRVFQKVGGRVFLGASALKQELKISFPEAVQLYAKRRRIEKEKTRKASAAALKKKYPFKPEWMLRSKFEVQGGSPGLGKRR